MVEGVVGTSGELSAVSEAKLAAAGWSVNPSKLCGCLLVNHRVLFFVSTHADYKVCVCMCVCA